jgi:hypothetical protein
MYEATKAKSTNTDATLAKSWSMSEEQVLVFEANIVPGV